MFSTYVFLLAKCEAVISTSRTVARLQAVFCAIALHSACGWGDIWLCRRLSDSEPLGLGEVDVFILILGFFL